MITVFTPTYNRAYILDKLYQSLRRQRNFDFEWLIVDDGSIDNTGDLVESWIRNENNFSIRYFKQENSGKHVAINKGVELARGEWFFIVDSDDMITDDAIEIIDKYLSTLPTEKNELVGIAGLRVHSNGEMIGTTFKGEFVDATSLKREKYNIYGDKAEVFKTDILRCFPFPVFENEKFLTEIVAWYQIAACGYKLRWINKPLIICEYIDDGLTRNAEIIKEKNPNGYLLTYELCYKYQRGLRQKYTAVFRYADLAHKLNMSNKEITKRLHISMFKLWIVFFVQKLFGKKQ